MQEKSLRRKKHGKNKRSFFPLLRNLKRKWEEDFLLYKGDLLSRRRQRPGNLIFKMHTNVMLGVIRNREGQKLNLFPIYLDLVKVYDIITGFRERLLSKRRRYL